MDPEKKVADEQGVVIDKPEDGTQDEPTPEEIAQKAKDKKLAAEAAGYRVKLREVERQLEESRKAQEDLKRKIEEGSATDQKSNAELASLKRALLEVQAENKQRTEKERIAEEKYKKSFIKNAVLNAVSGAKLLETAAAVDLLIPKAEIAPDETAVFNVKDENGEPTQVELNSENLLKFKLVPSIFIPAAGVSGSGSPKGAIPKPGAKPTEGVVDLERAKNDNEYYTKNKEAITRERQRQKTLPA